MRCAWRVMAVLCAVGACLPAKAADTEFPFDTELLLDANPMRGSKKLPNLEIGPQGQATIELWCNAVTAQLIVVQHTITILIGQKTERPCPPERARGDELGKGR